MSGPGLGSRPPAKAGNVCQAWVLNNKSFLLGVAKVSVGYWGGGATVNGVSPPGTQQPVQRLPLPVCHQPFPMPVLPGVIFPFNVWATTTIHQGHFWAVGVKFSGFKWAGGLYTSTAHCQTAFGNVLLAGSSGMPVQSQRIPNKGMVSNQHESYNCPSTPVQLHTVMGIIIFCPILLFCLAHWSLPCPVRCSHWELGVPFTVHTHPLCPKVGSQ